MKYRGEVNIRDTLVAAKTGGLGRGSTGSRKNLFASALVGAALAWSLSPVVVSAIGFGKPSINSALGEPLSVRVPLVSVQPGELDELSVGLAKANWYQVSGVEYPEIAPLLNLALDLGDPANPAIVVTTRNGVDQVAVPLVLELQWPQRVMRRQVNVLLNPVGYQPFRAPNLAAVEAPVDTAGEASSLVEASGTTAVGGFISPNARSAGSSSGQSVGQGGGSQNRASEAAANVIASTGNGAAASSTAASELTNPQASASPARPDYVTVQEGDTLSTIVDRFLPEGATRYQGRITFYEDNPAAFQDGDIHRIVRGAQLEVPPSAEILAWPASDARQRYLALATPPANSTNTAPTVDSVSTADATAPSTSGFRLSLLEVDEAEAQATATGAAEEPDSRIAQSGSLPEGADSNQAAVAGGTSDPGSIATEDLAMQGFSMKLTVMNAYIVELQDENRALKTRVENLEQKVEQLTKRGAAPASEAVVSVAGVSAEAEPDQNFFSEPAADLSPVLDSVSESGLIDDELAIAESSAAAASESPRESGAESVAMEPPAVTDSAEDDGSVVALRTAELEQQSELVPEENVSGEQVVADQSVQQNSVVDAGEVAARVIPGSADGARSGDTEGLVEAETVSPSLAYRQNLLERARGLFERFNTPIVQLVSAVVALGLALLLWMLLKDRRRYRLAEEFQEEEENYDFEDGVGVSYDGASEMTVLDMEDDPWMSQAEISEDQLENLHDSDVDLITQSEVYLTYNRPEQAIEVLQEEYAKADSDKFIVGSRILRIFEDMGQSEQRNSLLRDFIVTLNNDIEEFSASEWDSLRIELNGLRRAEHLSAVDGGDEAVEPIVDELSSDLNQRAGGFGVADQGASANDPDGEAAAGQRAAATEERRSKAVTRDDGVIELNYEARDKARSN